MKEIGNSQIKKIVILAISVAIISATLIFLYGPQSKLQTSSGTPAGLHPHITVVLGKDESAIGIPLIKLVNYTKGIAPGFENKIGIRIPIKDDSHVMLTLYDGNATNGTIIAAKATNISSEPVYLDNMDIIGAAVSEHGKSFSNVLMATVLGCTGNDHFMNNMTTQYENGTTVSHLENQTVICDNPSVLPQEILTPGKSITAHIIIPLEVGDKQITSVSIDASYNLLNSSYQYSMFVPYQEIR